MFPTDDSRGPRPSLPGLTRQSILPKDVDARDKPGHDGGGGLPVGVSTLVRFWTRTSGSAPFGHTSSRDGRDGFLCQRASPWKASQAQLPSHRAYGLE